MWPFSKKELTAQELENENNSERFDNMTYLICPHCDKKIKANSMLPWITDNEGSVLFGCPSCLKILPVNQ